MNKVHHVVSARINDTSLKVSIDLKLEILEKQNNVYYKFRFTDDDLTTGLWANSINSAIFEIVTSNKEILKRATKLADKISKIEATDGIISLINISSQQDLQQIYID